MTGLNSCHVGRLDQWAACSILLQGSVLLTYQADIPQGGCRPARPSGSRPADWNQTWRGGRAGTSGRGPGPHRRPLCSSK